MYKNHSLEGLIELLKKESVDIMGEYRQNPDHLAGNFVKNISRNLHRTPYLVFDTSMLELPNQEPWIHPRLSEADLLNFFGGFTPLTPEITQQIISGLQTDRAERERIREWHARIDRERETARQRRQVEHARQEARRQHNLAMRQKIENLKTYLDECNLGTHSSVTKYNLSALRREIGQDPQYQNIFKKIVEAHQHCHQCDLKENP